MLFVPAFMLLIVPACIYCDLHDDNNNLLKNSLAVKKGAALFNIASVKKL